MADYYTNFSICLPLTPEQREYGLQLHHQANVHRNEDRPLPGTFPTELAELTEDWCFETETDDDGIWLHSQNGGQDAACGFIRHLLRKFRFATSVSFEWSYDCSRPRTDAYGGGAAYITRSRIKSMTTSEWLRKLAGNHRP